jgi:sulfite exporter TauE/SafE
MQQLYPYMMNDCYLEGLLEGWLPDGIVDFLLLAVLSCYMVKGKELLLILGFHNDRVRLGRR